MNPNRLHFDLGIKRPTRLSDLLMRNFSCPRCKKNTPEKTYLPAMKYDFFMHSRHYVYMHTTSMVTSTYKSRGDAGKIPHAY